MNYSKQHEAEIMEMVRPIDIRKIEASAIRAAIEFYRPVLRLCDLYGPEVLTEQLRETAITVCESLNDVLRSHYSLDISSQNIVQELAKLEKIATEKENENDQDAAVLRTYVLLHRPPEILIRENPDLFILISPYL